MSNTMTRRKVLRGTMNGAAVSLSLPFLDCFLNGKGSALAATNAPLPIVFGSWIQNLGINPGRWKPETLGSNYVSGPELQVLDPFKDRMNIYSGMNYYLDGKPLDTHDTSLEVATMGSIPSGADADPTIDNIIADVIGQRTRFRSLEVALNDSKKSWSRRKGGAVNPVEPSPAALYTRIFGDDFNDPNAADFKPDPKTMARRSVLSALTDERKDIMRRVGSADRERLDEYFTSLRQIERQLDIELSKPAPLDACSVPGAVQEATPGASVDSLATNNELFGALLAHAIACGQTRVFNVYFDTMTARKPGLVRDFHSLTHEEPLDPDLGYQPDTTWFVNFTMDVFARFVKRLDDYKEGDGSVLDRTLLLWQTDHGYARTHSLEDLPIFTLGGAGGRLKTGLHVAAVGDSTTRVGLTVQQIMGVPVNTWGRLSNETSRPFTEVIA